MRTETNNRRFVIFLATTFLSAGALTADAAQVGWSLNAYANYEYDLGQGGSVPYGPVQDTKTASAGGGSASAEADATGIKLINLSQYPGETFVDSGIFHANTAASGAAGAAGVANLHHVGQWRFDALPGSGLDGTVGYFTATFRLQWDIFAQSGYGASYFDMGIGNGAPGFEFHTDAVYNGSESGNTFWTADPIPFTFGSAFNISWLLNIASASGSEGQTEAELELWNVHVSNAGGTELTRRTDYEWYEIFGPGETPPPPAGLNKLLLSVADTETAIPVASGSMVAVPEPSAQLLVCGGILGVCGLLRGSKRPIH